MKFKKFNLIKFIINVLLIIIVLSGAMFSYAKFIETNVLTEKHLDLESQTVSVESDGLEIAIISDTHFSKYYNLEKFEKVVASLKENQPDMILFAGDLIDNYDHYDGDVTEISAILKNIEAPLGKYAVFGNHDYGGGAEKEYSDILFAGGFNVLKNEYHPLDEYKLSLVGIDDFMLGNGDISKATWARDDYFNILLCHEPDIVDLILPYNIDLMISGHTHGGQINIPGYTYKFLPPYGEKYINGLYGFNNKRQTNLYVNPGLGTTQIHVRFLSRPEITYITLKRQASVN